MMEKKSALIAGATGLVGNSLLRDMLQDPYYQTVYVLSRRPLEQKHDKLKEIIMEMDTFNEEAMPAVDDVYCCLGTTMKKAGSKAAFRKVDYAYPLRLAQAARQKGAKQYLLVSAMGARKNSVVFYNQVKGEVEEAVAGVGLPALHILRPSILLGPRDEKRIGEKIGQVFMKVISPLLLGDLKKYRPIHAETIAQAMLNLAKKELTGAYIFESDNIKVLAGAP